MAPDVGPEIGTKESPTPTANDTLPGFVVSAMRTVTPFDDSLMLLDSRRAANSTTVAAGADVVAPTEDAAAPATDVPDVTAPARTGGSVTPAARA